MTSAGNVRICVPVCVREARDLAPAITRAARLAELVELRLDCLDPSQLDAALRVLPAILDTHSCGFVFTFRPTEQGGARPLSVDERIHFWDEFPRELVGQRERAATSTAGGEATANFVDIELDLVQTGRVTVQTGREPREWWTHAICSHHDFAGVPWDLENVYETMAGTRARILKIAVRANDIADCVAVFRLLERARSEGRALIAVAMDEAGIATRILAPSRGAFLTFAALDSAGATAPGQLTATALHDLYRINSIDEATAITGLVGSPVAHSVSPHMHNAAFAARGTNAVYIPFKTGDVDDFVRRMVNPRSREIDWRLRGLSVTAPHKTALMKHLDWIEPSAQEIGAVNTLVVDTDALRGYNTDAAAALAPLRGLLELRGARVAVIGAGGAARALLWSLRESGAHATVFARDAGRAREVAEKFGARMSPLDDARFDGFDVVVNATPLGTRGREEDATPALAAQLRGARVAYDLVYNPSETRFMREAREAGCVSVGGLSMLVAQAAAQFKLWTGEDAPFDVMRAAAEKQMATVRE